MQPGTGERMPLDKLLGMHVSLFITCVWLITLLGFAARFVFLDHPMRYDEAYNYLQFVAMGPWYIVTHYTPNNHILHTLMVWLSATVLGPTPAALRLPALAAGVALIPATAWLAWRVSQRALVSLLAALAVCVSSALIEYSVNARGYSLLALLTVLTAGWSHMAWKSPGRRALWVVAGALGAAGVYTVPVMVMPLLGLGVIALLETRRVAKDSVRRREIRTGLITASVVCMGAACMAYLPILVVGGGRPFSESGRMVYGILGQQTPTVWAVLVEAGRLWMRDVSPFGVVIVSVGAAAYAMRAFRPDGVERRFALGLLAMPVALVGVLLAPAPARIWLFGLPIFLVVAVQGACELLIGAADTLSRRVLRGCAVAGLAAVSILGLSNVLRAPILCSEPGGMVEVEEALDECQRYGTSRCAIVGPYTPATAYYMTQKRMPPLLLPSSSETERVYIVTDAKRELNALWHSGIEGFTGFGPPRVWRALKQSTVYLAERDPRSARR